MLVAIVLVAASIRLVYELLQPVVPYAVVVLCAWVLLRIVEWRRERW